MLRAANRGDTFGPATFPHRCIALLLIVHLALPPPQYYAFQVDSPEYTGLCTWGMELEVVYAKQPQPRATPSKKGVRGDDINPHGAGPCNVDDIDVAECWAAVQKRAEKILLARPHLGREQGLFARWE